MRATFLSVLFFITLYGNAQRACATLEYNHQQRLAAPQAALTATAIEHFIQQQTAGGSTENAAAPAIIFKIPVVVHVLYATEAQNVTDAQIQAGIAALNRDFRRNNNDTLNTPERFKTLAADVEIEFVLATADPEGRSTTGIIRKQTPVNEWRMDDKIKRSAQGGNDAWDAASYLNIWLGPMRNLLGYASLPGSDVKLDGIVINTPYFSPLTAPAPYHLGRTAVHEVGHWLGLKHLWGDAYCGDDLVDDTPKQGSYTSGCPSGVRQSCSNGTNGDMYMNYMDFTSDACMNLFTTGQKNRMRTLFNEGGWRASLLSSKGLNKPSKQAAPVVETVTPAVAQINIFPNPAANVITLQFGREASWIGRKITILNATGTSVKEIVVMAATQKVSITDLKAGVYFIQTQNKNQPFQFKLVKL